MPSRLMTPEIDAGAAAVDAQASDLDTMRSELETLQRRVARLERAIQLAGDPEDAKTKAKAEADAWLERARAKRRATGNPAILGIREESL